jgi:hypothetical protein
VEKLFGDLPSIQSKIFYPFLKSYWTKAVDAQAYSFRTAQAYTQNAILDACSVDNPCLSARILLRRMAFCLYGSFPEQIARWLNSDDPNYPLQQRTSGSTALCEVTDFGKSSEQTDSSLTRDPTNRAGIEQ